jgi:hypothetical protein
MSPPSIFRSATKNARQTPSDRKSQKTRNSSRSHLDSKSNRGFDPQAFLATIGEGRRLCSFRKSKPSSRKGIPRTQCFICRPAR